MSENTEPSITSVDRMTGLLLLAITVLVLLNEWLPELPLTRISSVLVIVLTGFFALRVRGNRLAFIIVAVGLTFVTLFAAPDWLAILEKSLFTTAFICAFFCSLNTLRNAASTSASIEKCGMFLAHQPPGRRYAALTLGTQAFAFLLNYGAIALLGSLAMVSASNEPNAEIRAHRIRRMLLAIQRGFISSLPWSPLSYSVVITTTLIPGTSWVKAVLPCMVIGLLLSGIGWIMDSIFKPRLSTVAGPPQRSRPAGNWFSLFPLLVLMLILGSLAALLHWSTDVRVTGIMVTIVPLIAFGWIGWQSRANRALPTVLRRARSYVLKDLSGFRNELALLMTAGFIGTLGGQLLAPIISSAGIDLTTIPSWVILVSIVWLLPMAGQIGMNPIMAVSLFAPILPSAAAMGVEPTAIMVAITAGWALTGASSPFTATTLLIGSFANISATKVGLQWNGAFALVGGVVVSVWVICYALFIS